MNGWYDRRLSGVFPPKGYVQNVFMSGRVWMWVSEMFVLL